MLENPNIPDQLILAGLEEEYGLQASQVSFLPVGYDVNSAAYRAVTGEGAAYFLKLRKGPFDGLAAALPQFLKEQGIQPILATAKTRRGELWGRLEDYQMLLYPFIEGENGYAAALSDQQRVEFGAALRGIHAAHALPGLAALIRRETYSSRWRESVRAFQAQVEAARFEDPTAAKLAAFMQAKKEEIAYIVRRAGELGDALQERDLEFVLCHSDLHPGNLLISQEAGGEGAFYIVDWDSPIFAPKELDLMFAGTRLGSPAPGEREEALFFQGYGPAVVDRMALAYYRYERMVQDMAAFGEQLFLSTEGGEDREQGYEYFTGFFLPGNELEIALKTDPLSANGQPVPWG